MAEARSLEAVRRDIAQEREELVHAVERLRSGVAGTLDLQGKIASRRLVVAPAAFATAFVLAGGVGATMRYFARRGREH